MTKTSKRESGLRHLTVSALMKEIIFNLQQLGKTRTSETYRTTLNSFLRFRNGSEVLVRDLTPELLQTYEAYLKANNVTMNTVSFYMRILRAAYNRAVEQGVVQQNHPFARVYTGVGQTEKRSVAFAHLKQIKELDLSGLPGWEYARDMFIFSLYTRGMSFIDMAYLLKTDLKDGILCYRRRKTGQLLHIRWENCMQEVVDKYPHPDSPYLLPILTSAGQRGRMEYKAAIWRVNRYLKKIGEILQLPIPLTMYVARHSWASVARSRNIPLSVISAGMGHHSETVTQIYLASLDATLIDKANRTVLEGL